MSSRSSARRPSSKYSSPTPQTLAVILDRLQAMSNLPPRARQDLLSAVRSFCRAVGLEPAMLPASIALLRPRAIQIAPAALGMSAGRWRNICSGLRKALDLTGAGGPVRRKRMPVSPAWRALLSLITPPPRRSTFMRLARLCSAEGLVPEQVTDLVIVRLQAAQEAEALLRDPARTTEQVCRAWNQAVATVPGWPAVRLSVPNRSLAYAMPWSAFPPSLGIAVAAYHRESVEPDPLDPQAARPVAPSTVRQRDLLLRRLATALVERGVPTDDLRTLADLVRPARLREGLRFFLDRFGNQITATTEEIAKLARSIGHHVVKLPPAELVELDAIRRRVTRDRTGLTPKNRGRLAQFADEASVQALLDLPARLVMRNEHKPPTRHLALVVQTALAIELLIVTAMRIGNLRSLRYGRHFVKARSDGREGLHLIIPAGEVKNKVNLEFPLPAETVVLLDLYMKRYQPLLSGGSDGDALFPGARGIPKNRTNLGEQVSRTILKEIGLKLNPHLFRHLAAFLYLEQEPGGYEVVRRILGHRSMSTTTGSYAGFEAPAAVRHFDETILSRRTLRLEPRSRTERRK